MQVLAISDQLELVAEQVKDLLEKVEKILKIHFNNI